MKKKLLYFVFATLIVSSVFAQDTSKTKKNEVEFSVFLMNTTNFHLAKNFIPEFGYTRYLGKYFKTGIFFGHTKYSTGVIADNFVLKMAFLPLPLFDKSKKILNHWELEGSMNYLYQIQRGRYINMPIKNYNKKVFIRGGISRKIHKQFYLLSNIGLLNDNSIYIGIRWKF